MGKLKKNPNAKKNFLIFNTQKKTCLKNKFYVHNFFKNVKNKKTYKPQILKNNKFPIQNIQVVKKILSG